MERHNSEAASSKAEVMKAGVARLIPELSPLADFGLTENAIVAAGYLVASGEPFLPVMTTFALVQSYFIDKIRHNKALGV